MRAISRADRIRSYFTAYRMRDRAVIEEALADDFTFTSPYDNAIDRKTYFERCWPTSDRQAEHIIERIFEQNDEAFVTYRLRTKDGKEFRNTEFFVFEDKMLKSVTVYFGPSYHDAVFVKQKE